jgi:ABC-type multidrug transport system fused ATPase/permease subunit
MSEVAAQKQDSMLHRVLGKNTFDDRVDVDSDINTIESLSIIGRCVKLITHARGLFLAKFLLQLGLMFPVLLLPWMAKIVIDNVILQRPFGDTAVAYPPFMDPIVNFVDGKAPLEIMLALTTLYAVMLVTVGTRSRKMGASLEQGRDAATQAENALSSGGSTGGGIWGMLDFMVNVRLTQTMANHLRTRLFDRLSRLPMTVLDDQRIGDSLYRVLYDAPHAPDLAYKLTLAPFFYLFSALVNIYILQYSYGEMTPELIWIAWATFPAAFLITFPFSGILRRTSQNKRAAGAATTNAMEESLGNIGAVQSLGGTRREQERFAERSSHTFLRERYAMLVLVVVGSIAGAAAGIAAIYVTIIISNQIIEGAMSPGDFAVLFGVYKSIVASAMYFGAMWIKLQETIAAVRRVFFFVDYESEEDRPGTVELSTISEGVRIEGVDFDYPDGHRALTNVDLELPMGELVALVGPTGAGKTTLAYLIPSLVMPTAGRVLIDGKDLAEVDLDSLRRQVTYVFQEHLLLSESIRENLLLANPEASEAEMMAALGAAGCMEFIESMPDGIDSVLGRSGDTLSVGQQQRLSIARGLVRDTRILILDEPTAALDPRTEGQLVESLRAAVKDRLVIVIAHRLSTIRRADRIVFLEDGEIRDVGNHEELMADPDSPYRTFVELQNG